MAPVPLLDAHTHFFSRPFFEALARQSSGPGGVEDRLARLAADAGIDVPGPDLDAHLARWLAAFDAGGVAHAVTFASLPGEADAVAAAVARAPDRLTGYALVDPRAPGAAETTRAHFEERAFRGVLLFPAMHHFHAGGPEARGVLEVVAAHEGVVVVHCGMLQVKIRDLLGLPRPYDLAYANPLDVVPAANAFPAVRFVIPHFGAGFLRECLMAGAQCENVYVDTSSSNAWMATQTPCPTLAEVLRRTLAVLGPRRVLFGTDSGTVPRGWRGDLFRAQEAALDEIGASAEDRAAIFGGNAARILGRSLPRRA
jgi:predicted TIM-barrel fold metal-dependent hydrolase